MTNVVPDDLRRDADRWTDVASGIRDVFLDDSIGIEERAWTTFGVDAGLPDLYQGVLTALTALPPQASAELVGLAQRLREVADYYEQEDEKQHGLYQRLTTQTEHPR